MTSIHRAHRTWVPAVVVAALAIVAGSAFAAGGGGANLESPSIDTSNTKSLQRGAQVFVNHCMGCHSADYHRYSRLAQDLDLSEEIVENNLIFTTVDLQLHEKLLSSPRSWRCWGRQHRLPGCSHASCVVGISRLAKAGIRY